MRQIEIGTTNMNKIFFAFLAVAVAVTVFSILVSATDDLMALQGNVRQSGVNLDYGNLTVFIFDSMTAGNLVYNSTGDFNNSVVSGKYDVILGNGSRALTLEYGKLYYLEMYVNNEKFDFNGLGRQEFQSSVGQINGTVVNPFQINDSHLSLNINLSNATNIQAKAVNKTTGTFFVGRLLDDILDTIIPFAYNQTTAFNNSMGMLIYNYSNIISPGVFATNTTSLFNGTALQIGLGTTTPYYRLDVNGSANISGSLFVGGKLVNQFLYNQSSVTDITQWLYNQTTAFNTSMGTVIYNHTTTANKSITDAYGKFFYNQSAPYDAFNYNQTLGAITKVIGTIDFNGGWTSNGLTIQGGNLYAQTLFVYNISSLGVNNLEVNGSLIPNPGFNNTFDVGNSSSQWKNGWFGTEVKVNGVAVSPWLYNQTTAFNNSMGMLIYNHTREFNNSMGAVIYNYSNVISGSPFTTNATGLWNETSLQVGLGTSSPNAKLEINGTGTYVFNASNGSISGLIVNASGNVGIGTATPFDKLSIGNNKAGISDLIRLEYPTATSDGARITWNFGSGGADIGSIKQERLGSGIYAITFSNWDGVSNADVLTLRGYGTANSNSVGIGTASPNAKLEVNGTGLYTLNVSNGTISGLVVRSDGGVSIGTPVTENTLTVAPVPFSASQSGGISLIDKGLNWNFGINLTSDAGGEPRLAITPDTGAETLSIMRTRRVGINTAVPTHALNVNGSVNITGDLILNSTNLRTFAYNQSAVIDITQWLYNQTTAFNNSMGVLIYNHTREYNASMGVVIYNYSNVIGGFVANATAIWNSSTRQVGIGTSSPNAKLEINGTDVYVLNITNGSRAGIVGWNNGSNINLGVGNIVGWNPQHTLTVYGSINLSNSNDAGIISSGQMILRSSAGQVMIASNSAGANGILLAGGTGVITSYATSLTFAPRTNGDIIFTNGSFTGGTYGRIKGNSGFLGLGTASPNAMIEVNGTFGADNLLNISNGSSTGLLIQGGDVSATVKRFTPITINATSFLIGNDPNGGGQSFFRVHENTPKGGGGSEHGVEILKNFSTGAESIGLRVVGYNGNHQDGSGAMSFVDLASINPWGYGKNYSIVANGTILSTQGDVNISRGKLLGGGGGVNNNGRVVWCDAAGTDRDSGNECCALSGMKCSEGGSGSTGVWVDNGGIPSSLTGVACSSANGLNFIAFCY